MRYLLILLVFFIGCGVPSLDTIRPQADAWDIQHSQGFPAHPAPYAAGMWYFDFPDWHNVIGYITQSYTGPAKHSVSMTVRIETTGTPVFNGNLEPDNTCTTPASVRLLLQERGDDLATNYYRWWSNPDAIVLGPTHETTITVPLTPDRWSTVLGQFGTTNVKAFNQALANLGHVGMTFGGGCFFGHGVNVSSGTARFELISYTIS